MSKWLLILMMLMLCVPLLAQVPPTQTCASTAPPPSRYQHVVVFSFENRTWSGTGGIGFGATAMPYMHSLAASCSYFSDWAETNTSQNSLTQYIGETSGVNNTATVNDCNPSTTCRSTDNNIFRQVRLAGGTARNYVEGATTGCSASGNAAKHIPALYYFGSYIDSSGVTHNDHDFCSTEVRPFTEFDVNNLPTYAFITPTLCNDGHDCNNSTVDAWASTHVQAVLNSSDYLAGNTAVLVWYDEDHPVPNAIIAPTAHAGNITPTGIGSHAALLKTIELILGLPVMQQGQLITAADLRAITGLASTGGSTVSVFVSPTSSTILSGNTLQFTGSVTGTTNTGVTWTATKGTISSSGLYTAPTVTSNTTATVTATSVADAAKSASATVTITAPAAVTVTISPTSATVQSGGTQQFSATVAGTTNTGVTWTATKGTVSSTGLYTAPTVTSNTTAGVTATSVADTTKSASAAVTITAPATVAVTISPTSATITSGGTQQFTAKVSNATNISVTWLATIGTVSSTGLFTAPTVAANAIGTVKATSVADTTKSVSATVTVIPVLVPPSAVLTVSPQNGTVPLAVRADSSGSSDSDGTITSRTINFGDGTPLVTTVSASHTYTNVGSYAVTLSVTDNSGLTSTTSKNVTVSPSQQTGGTSPGYFGMHETNAAAHNWPSVGFGTFRTWDVYPHVSWADINTAKGVYDWTNLDNLVSLAQSHGVDLIYTLGRTPVWASSNPTGSCPNNPDGSCYPPSNQQDWKDFVAGITARYAGTIKYWELWNEPNASNFWAGTTAQMVTMAQDAYPIIKAGDSGAVVLSPAPQGTGAYRWMDGYLAAGGGAYADVVSFHGYLGSHNGVADPPENIASLIANMKGVMTSYGQGSKELWDTEHSWGNDANLPDQDQQAAWLARHAILSWSNGAARSIWYLWDSPSVGTLWDTTSGIHKPGIAYGQVYKWLVGTTLTAPCSMANDSTWTCVLTRPGGYQAEIIWNASTTKSYTAPSQYTQYCDLVGNTVTIPTGGSVAIGAKPILLEAGSPTPADTPPTAVLAVAPQSGTAPLTVTADSSASYDADGTIVTRTIDFGDGTVIAGSASRSHIYNSAGQFTLKLTVTDDAGLTASASQTIVVSDLPPSIAIAISPATSIVQSGGTQQFVATLQNTANTAVSWSATVGTVTASGLYTAPTVNANTTATVTATSVADPSKSASASVTITVPPPPPPPSVLLPNPGFELGAFGWTSNLSGGATVAVLSDAASAHGGTNYAEAKSGTGQYVAYFAADAKGRPLYFPVTPGQVITFGGWVYRVSGDGYARWKIQLSDANKQTITHVSPVSNSVTTAGVWTFQQATYTVPADKAYVRFLFDVYGSTVPTLVRFDDGMLQIK